jgi:DNA replication and repair protein RecF
MTLVQLDVERFRCISRAQLHLDRRCNFITGPNASGKTSLLEAIFLLGSGHSFRTHLAERLIQHGSDDFLTVGRIQANRGEEVLGLRGWKDKKEGRINGESTKSLAELAARFPVQSIDPDVHQLLEDGPSRRRQFLDWVCSTWNMRFTTLGVAISAPLGNETQP